MNEKGCLGDTVLLWVGAREKIILIEGCTGFWLRQRTNIGCMKVLRGRGMVKDMGVIHMCAERVREV